MKTLGYLGLGVMGYGMTGNLIDKSGGPVYGYDPVPALRERHEDIVPLANSFLNEYNLRYQKSIQFSEDAFQHLEQYDWPGNIRELQNWVERVVIMAKDSDVVSVSLPSADSAPRLYTSGFVVKDWEKQSYAELIDAAEREIFLQARQKYKTSVAVAKVLGISQTTAARKLRKASE